MRAGERFEHCAKPRSIQWALEFRWGRACVDQRHAPAGRLGFVFGMRPTPLRARGPCPHCPTAEFEALLGPRRQQRRAGARCPRSGLDGNDGRPPIFREPAGLLLDCYSLVAPQRLGPDILPSIFISPQALILALLGRDCRELKVFGGGP